MGAGNYLCGRLNTALEPGTGVLILKMEGLMQIKEETISMISAIVNSLCIDYMDALNEAYSKHDDESFKISFGVTINPDAGGNKVEVTINFVTGKVKDKIIRTVYEGQGELFEASKDD